MLLPKRVKYRKQQRGRMKGAASRGNFVAYGEYGIAACEPGWITSNQIEAARVAMTRSTKRGGKVWIGSTSSCYPQAACKVQDRGQGRHRVRKWW